MKKLQLFSSVLVSRIGTWLREVYTYVISLLFLLYFVTYDIDFSALIQLLHAMVVYW